MSCSLLSVPWFAITRPVQPQTCADLPRLPPELPMKLWLSPSFAIHFWLSPPLPALLQLYCSWKWKARNYAETTVIETELAQPSGSRHDNVTSNICERAVSTALIPYVICTSAQACDRCNNILCHTARTYLILQNRNPQSCSTPRMHAVCHKK